VRGASALHDALSTSREPPLRILVLWEPVLTTDIAPPTTAILGLIPDDRAAQFWDPDRLLSAELIATARQNPERMKPGDEIPEVVWDVVLVYPPGAIWTDRIPFPAWYGGEVVGVVDEVRREIAKLQQPTDQKSQ
jgi:hypothetical protein